MSVKFIHTADWQIGMKALSAGDAAKAVREARIQAARNVVQAAIENEASFILHAGDIFEDNAVDRAQVRQIGEILAAFPREVYLIPGNHDPLVPGSVWEHPVWQENANLHVCREAVPVERPDCVILPCPLKEKYSRCDPTAWIRSPEEGETRIRIGLAHGTIEGIPVEDDCFPVPRDAGLRSGLDYLALGHWHSTATYETGGTCRMAYSGTHETSKFGERDSGNCLVVEIAHHKAVPAIRSIRSGILQWLSIESEIHDSAGLAAARSQLDAVTLPSSHLVRLTLTGVLTTEAQPAVAALQEIMATRFLRGQMDSTGLLPAPEDDSWIATIPLGPHREAASRLLDLSRKESDPAGRLVAARALIELFKLNASL